MIISCSPALARWADGAGSGGRAVRRDEAGDHRGAGGLARAGAIGQGAVGTGRAVRWPGDRRCRPGFVQGRLRRGGRAVRAAVAALRRDAPADQGHAPAGNCGRRRQRPAGSLLPPPRQSRGIPVWIGSWGSRAGMRRVARAGDGWLASAYNTTPEAFTAAMEVLGGELESQQRPSGDFPNALVTMWAWITGSRSEADRVLSEIVAPLVRRDPAELRGRICVGSAGECAELLSRYARAGCQRVHFWPVGDERAPDRADRGRGHAASLALSDSRVPVVISGSRRWIDVPCGMRAWIGRVRVWPSPM